MAKASGSTLSPRDIANLPSHLQAALKRWGKGVQGVVEGDSEDALVRGVMTDAQYLHYVDGVSKAAARNNGIKYNLMYDDYYPQEFKEAISYLLKPPKVRASKSLHEGERKAYAKNPDLKAAEDELAWLEAGRNMSDGASFISATDIVNARRKVDAIKRALGQQNPGGVKKTKAAKGEGKIGQHKRALDEATALAKTINAGDSSRLSEFIEMMKNLKG